MNARLERKLRLLSGIGAAGIIAGIAFSTAMDRSLVVGIAYGLLMSWVSENFFIKKRNQPSSGPTDTAPWGVGGRRRTHSALALLECEQRYGRMLNGNL
jgi:hypothetical protein